jgi:hypothetical protein
VEAYIDAAVVAGSVAGLDPRASFERLDHPASSRRPRGSDPAPAARCLFRAV